jgi:hypothetical protein
MSAAASLPRLHRPLKHRPAEGRYDDVLFVRRVEVDPLDVRERQAVEGFPRDAVVAAEPEAGAIPAPEGAIDNSPRREPWERALSPVVLTSPGRGGRTSFAPTGAKQHNKI